MAAAKIIGVAFQFGVVVTFGFIFRDYSIFFIDQNVNNLFSFLSESTSAACGMARKWRVWKFCWRIARPSRESSKKKSVHVTCMIVVPIYKRVTDHGQSTTWVLIREKLTSCCQNGRNKLAMDGRKEAGLRTERGEKPPL